MDDTFTKPFRDEDTARDLDRLGERIRMLSNRPSRQSERSRCGAYARSTRQPCQAPAMANGRCKLHGGLSTGPKTADGKARALANLRQYRKPQALESDAKKQQR